MLIVFDRSEQRLIGAIKIKTYSDDECLFLQKNTTAPTMIKIAGMAMTIPTMAP